MRRPSRWLLFVVLLLGALFLREPRLQRSEEVFLDWLLANSQPHLPAAPVTVVEINHNGLSSRKKTPVKPGAVDVDKFLQGNSRGISPLEYALFLQAVMEFQPTVVAMEPILKWTDVERDQEQIFIDQAMRVPKLLLGAHLSATFNPDEPGQELQAFTQVSGKQSELPEFSSVDRQPDEDLRLVSTSGFTNLPDELGATHVPLLFHYRGQVVPSFPLQAILLWLRTTPAEVKVEIGSQITLPNGWKIPIRGDGTVTINPHARGQVRQLALDELLLAAQQHDTKQAGGMNLDDLGKQIVVLRAADGPLSPPNVFALTIAAIQNNAYVRRVGWWFDALVIALAMALSVFIWRVSKLDAVLYAMIATAAYLMIALGVAGEHLVWLPGWMPLGLLWFVIAARVLRPAGKQTAAS